MNESHQSSQRNPDTTCFACGCLCDDIDVALDGKMLIDAINTCPTGADWFRSLTAESGGHLVDGLPASYESALQTANRLLAESEAPLIYGFTQSTNQAVATGIRLAEQQRAHFDLALSPTTRAMAWASSQRGMRTATHGESRDRADLVLFIGCDPHRTHPRFAERYLPEQVRTVVIDDAENQTAKDASEYFRVPGRQHSAAIHLLRSLANDKPTTSALAIAETGIELERWKTLTAEMACARLVAVYYDHFAEHDAMAACDALVAWVVESSAPMILLPLGSAGNATGAIETATWQTGCPFAIDFTSGGPRFAPVTGTANHHLENGDVDLAMLVTASQWYLTDEATTALQEKPIISVGHAISPALPRPKVHFSAAAPGLSVSGTVHRSDHVALPIRKLLPAALPTCDEILNEFAEIG